MEQTMPPIFAERAQGIGIFFVLVLVFISLAINVLYVIAFCKIFGKAGYHWALGLLMIVPIANFIMPLVLAFCEWPIFKQMQVTPSQNQTPIPVDPPP